VLALTIVLCITSETTALHQKDQILLYNLGLGGLVGGVGAVINREEDQTWYLSFVRGFAQGSVGGFISYQGKMITHKIGRHKKLEYGWVAKIIHSTGASIVENAALNKDFCESWSIHVGFVRLETEPLNRSVRFRLLPYALYSFARASFLGRFDLEKTLKLGTPYFGTGDMIDGRSAGRSFNNDVIVNENYEFRYQAIAHEYVHNLQFREYLSLNSLFQERVRSNRICRGALEFLYPDIPYQPVAYKLEGTHSAEWYFANFFEMEAEYFATLKEVPIPRH
jgi:hypothetical protein